MINIRMFRTSALVSMAAMLLAVNGCKKTESVTPELAVKTYSNLYAPVTSVIPPGGGQPQSTGPFVYFNLRTGQLVPETDASTSNWDIAFRSTTILVNSGTSGPGQGAAVVVNGVFGNLTQAPADADFRQDNGSTLAIPTGSGNGWYTAVTNTFTVITPITGKVIMIRTANGQYAKVEILNYYKDAPAVVTDAIAQTDFRYYTFRYAINPAVGDRNLK